MSDDPLNGHERPKPLSMMIQKERDPLRPMRHQVVDARGYIIAQSEEPIELLKIEMAKQHAVFDPNREVHIIDESCTVVHTEGSYWVEPQEGPPDEARVELRDKWLENVMRFLLPPGLFERRNDEASQKRIQRWFRGNKVSLEVRPDGGAVRVWRDGVVLCSWGC